MDGAQPTSSPVTSGSKLFKYDGEPLLDPTIYRSLVGFLQYAMLMYLDTHLLSIKSVNSCILQVSHLVADSCFLQFRQRHYHKREQLIFINLLRCRLVQRS